MSAWPPQLKVDGHNLAIGLIVGLIITAVSVVFNSWYSHQPEGMASVPNVVGQSVREAVSNLVNNRLKAVTEPPAPVSVSQTVTSQTPQAGKRVAFNTEVHLFYQPIQAHLKDPVVPSHKLEGSSFKIVVTHSRDIDRDSFRIDGKPVSIVDSAVGFTTFWVRQGQRHKLTGNVGGHECVTFFTSPTQETVPLPCP